MNTQTLNKQPEILTGYKAMVVAITYVETGGNVSRSQSSMYHDHTLTLFQRV